MLPNDVCACSDIDQPLPMWHIVLKKRRLDLWPLTAYERFLLATAPEKDEEGPAGFRIDMIGGKGHLRNRPFGLVFNNDRAKQHHFSSTLRKLFVPGARICPICHPTCAGLVN